jgi:hypothetical protein
MNNSNRGTLITGITLLALGAILIVLNLIPGININQFWPLIIIAAGIGFFLPVLIWPGSKHGLSGLFIPGTIILVLGLLFLYNAISRDWASWAFAWMLIPASVGFGIFLGAWIGEWGKAAKATGLWIGVISLAFFSLFAALFGTFFMKSLGAIFLIAAGVLFILYANRKPKEAQ